VETDDQAESGNNAGSKAETKTFFRGMVHKFF
jgi:hypothetical protein